MERLVLRDNPFALDLSLSHGARWLCPAIGRGIMVGTDIEALPDPDEIDGVVELMFSKRERRQMRRLQRPSWLPSLDRREEALKREGGAAGKRLPDLLTLAVGLPSVGRRAAFRARQRLAAGLEMYIRKEGIAGVIREMVAPRNLEAAE